MTIEQRVAELENKIEAMESEVVSRRLRVVDGSGNTRAMLQVFDFDGKDHTGLILWADGVGDSGACFTVESDEADNLSMSMSDRSGQIFYRVDNGVTISNGREKQEQR